MKANTHLEGPSVNWAIIHTTPHFAGSSLDADWPKPTMECGLCPTDYIGGAGGEESGRDWEGKEKGFFPPFHRKSREFQSSLPFQIVMKSLNNYVSHIIQYTLIKYVFFLE